MQINATLIGQMITFTIFVWFTMRVVWPILSSQLEARKKYIADGLASGEAGRNILSKAEESAAKKIADARQHCYKILADADEKAELILENARVQARVERDDIIATGHVAVERAVKKAKKDLQVQVVDIALLGAEKILERSVNREDHQKILEELMHSLDG